MNRFIASVFLASVSALATAPAWAVDIPCGSSIDAAVAANPPGTVFNLAPSCTYSRQTFHTKSNITLKGAGAGSTILDGGGLDQQMTNGNSDAATGVIIDGVTIRNYIADAPEARNAQLVIWDGWIVRNSTITGSGGWGIYHEGSGSMISNLITANKHGGIGGLLGLPGTDGKAGTISGNEISNNNTRHDNQDDDAGGLKILGGGQALLLTNNYVHDNYSDGLWCDGGGTDWTIKGNTVIHNNYHGIHWETCDRAEITANVVNRNGAGPSPIGGAQIFLSSAGNANVHHNNLLVPGGARGGIIIQADCRPDARASVNDTLLNNTVTFASGGGDQGFVSYWTGSCPYAGPGTGSLSNNNSFYAVNISDPHWYWLGTTTAEWSAYRTSTGQDPGSTLAPGNASVSGCTKVGCSGSGWPVASIPEAPFGGTARSLTTRIQAEDYDVGGKNVAYNAADGGSKDGASYRPDYVNLYKTTDSGGGLKIGYQQPGNFYKYTINVVSEGLYAINMRVANIETGASYRINVDGTTAVTGIAVPNTGGYDLFFTVKSGVFGLTAGQHVFQIVVDTVGPTGFGGDLNWLQGVSVPVASTCKGSITLKAC